MVKEFAIWEMIQVTVQTDNIEVELISTSKIWLVEGPASPAALRRARLGQSLAPQLSAAV